MSLDSKGISLRKDIVDLLKTKRIKNILRLRSEFAIRKRKQKNPTVEDKDMFTYIGTDIIIALDGGKEIVFRTNTLKWSVVVSFKDEKARHNSLFSDNDYFDYSDESYSIPKKWAKLIDEKINKITILVESNKQHRTMHPDSNEVAILFETENSNFIISVCSKGLEHSAGLSIFQLEDVDSQFFEGREKKHI